MEQAGYYTKSQIVAKMGGDFYENLRSISREQEAAERLGVTLDRDIIESDQEVIE